MKSIATWQLPIRRLRGVVLQMLWTHLRHMRRGRPVRATASAL